MKKILLQAILFLSVSMLIVSCASKQPKEARLIPKDASFVVAVDPGSLQEKLKKGNIDIDTLFKQVIGNDSLKAKDKKAFEDFKNAGVDWSGKLFVFMTRKTDANKGTGNFINILASLKDSSKLQAYLLSIDKYKGRDVKKEKGYSYIRLNTDGMVSWTDKFVIATIYHYTEGQKGFLPDSIMNTNQPAATNQYEEISKEVNHYYMQKEDESMAAVKPFTDMFKENADGYFLSSTNGLINTMSLIPLQLPKLEELLKDNYTTGTFNFADGKIVASSNFYANKPLSAILTTYAGSTVNTAMIENYPSQNIDMAILVSFNPEIFGGVLKELEVESLADGFLEKMGISTKDLYKCLKGDIAVAISDFSIAKNTGNISTKPVARMIFNAAIGDTASFHKLMGKAVESGFIIKENNSYKSGTLMRSMGLFLQTDNKNLVLASDSLTYAAYAAKTSKAAISPEVMNQLKGKSTAVFIDLDKVLGGFSPTGSSDTNTTSSLNTVRATFKDVIATSDNFDGIKTPSAFTVRMKDKKQNSLVTLIKLIPAVTEQIKKNRIAQAQGSDGDEGILSLPFLSRLDNL